MDEVEQCELGALIATGDRDDEPQVVGDQRVLGLQVPALDPTPESAFLGRGQQPVLRRLREVLVERVNGVVGKLGIGVTRSGSGATDVVVDLHSQRAELVAEILHFTWVEPEVLSRLLDLGLGDVSGGYSAV